MGADLSLLRARLNFSFELPSDGMLSMKRTAEAEPHDTLRRGGDGATCVAVCRRTVDIVEAEFAKRRAEGAAIACAPGCTFCCHQRVGAYAHEAIALWSRLHTHPLAARLITRILANAREIESMTVEAHRKANLRCALLVDGRCAAYEVRPLACARYHSLSRERCEHAFNHPQDVGTRSNARPALAELQAFGTSVEAATEAALGEAGLSSTKAELHQLLRVLIENPSLVERWSAGDDIAAFSTDAARATDERVGASTRSSAP